jgi:hypothetical protein
MLALAVACDFPRDAEGTLARVRGGTMRVGVGEHTPWVRLTSQEPEGVEPALLMKERPKKTDGSGLEPLPEQLEKRLEELDWIEAAEVRLREDGHVFFGEAYVVPRGGRADTGQISRAVDHAMPLNWRLHELTVTLGTNCRARVLDPFRPA